MWAPIAGGRVAIVRGARRSALAFLNLTRPALQLLDHGEDFLQHLGVSHCQGEFADPSCLVAEFGGGLHRTRGRRSAGKRSGLGVASPFGLIVIG